MTRVFDYWLVLSGTLIVGGLFLALAKVKIAVHFMMIGIVCFFALICTLIIMGSYVWLVRKYR